MSTIKDEEELCQNLKNLSITYMYIYLYIFMHIQCVYIKPLGIMKESYIYMHVCYFLLYFSFLFPHIHRLSLYYFIYISFICVSTFPGCRISIFYFILAIFICCRSTTASHFLLAKTNGKSFPSVFPNRGNTRLGKINRLSE